MTEDEERNQFLERSWVQNAGAWTNAVRLGKIASRQAGTDHAILSAMQEFAPCRVLDLGCGEGWLARALHTSGYDTVGVDSSSPLIETAAAAGGGRFVCLSYEELHESLSVLGGPFPLIVSNFALLGETLRPVLANIRQLLASGGILIIQTLHPLNVNPASEYVSEWRIETFSGIDEVFPMPMPYFFRTFGRWVEDLNAEGFRILRVREPLNPDTGRPLSLLLYASCAAPCAGSEVRGT